jgi:23S rRNA (guanosine2251-2'-O)-methyltransferase
MNQKTRNEELQRLTADEFRKAEKQPLVIILDNVRSLNNVGSVFRTADAFRIEAIYLCGVTGCPPNKEIEKTALGATSTVNWKHFSTTPEALKELRAEGYRILSVEQAKNSISLNHFTYEGALALVFGNEVYGVAQEVIDFSDGVIEIPQAGTKHSMNVAVSAGIVLWELLRTKL